MAPKLAYHDGTTYGGLGVRHRWQERARFYFFEKGELGIFFEKNST